MEGPAFRYLLVSLMFFAMAAPAARWHRRLRDNPHRDPVHPERVRMPRATMWIGLALIGLGVLIPVLLYSPVLQETSDLIGTIVVGALVGLAGLWTLVLYLRWYMVMEPDRVRFRSWWGPEKTIRFRDIASHKVVTSYRQPYLKVRSVDGTTLRVSPNAYDTSPLQRAIAFHEETGSWPGDTVDWPGRPDTER